MVIINRQLRNSLDKSNLNEDILRSLDYLRKDFTELKERQSNIENGVNVLIKGFGFKVQDYKVDRTNTSKSILGKSRNND